MVGAHPSTVEKTLIFGYFNKIFKDYPHLLCVFVFEDLTGLGSLVYTGRGEDEKGVFMGTSE